MERNRDQYEAFLQDLLVSLWNIAKDAKNNQIQQEDEE